MPVISDAIIVTSIAYIIQLAYEVIIKSGILFTTITINAVVNE